MSIMEQVYIAAVLWWAELDKLPLMGGITAMVVAVLRTHQQGRILWSESLLCGIFAAIASTCISFIGMLVGLELSVELVGFVSGAIGWYGTHKSVAFIEERYNRLSGGKDDSDSKEL